MLLKYVAYGQVTDSIRMENCQEKFHLSLTIGKTDSHILDERYTNAIHRFKNFFPCLKYGKFSRNPKFDFQDILNIASRIRK